MTLYTIISHSQVEGPSTLVMMKAKTQSEEVDQKKVCSCMYTNSCMAQRAIEYYYDDA